MVECPVCERSFFFKEERLRHELEQHGGITPLKEEPHELFKRKRKNKVVY